MLRVLHSLFGNPQPIEIWLLLADVAIVGLIVWLDIPEWSHKRRVAKVARVLSDFMFKGQSLAQGVPNPRELTDFAAFAGWLSSVESWRTDVAQFLSEKSSRSASAFLLITVSEANVSNVVHPLEGWSFRLTGDHREAYQALLAYLTNLRSIIEKPEVYFD